MNSSGSGWHAAPALVVAEFTLAFSPGLGHCRGEEHHRPRPQSPPPERSPTSFRYPLGRPSNSAIARNAVCITSDQDHHTLIALPDPNRAIALTHPEHHRLVCDGCASGIQRAPRPRLIRLPHGSARTGPARSRARSVRRRHPIRHLIVPCSCCRRVGAAAGEGVRAFLQRDLARSNCGSHTRRPSVHRHVRPALAHRAAHNVVDQPVTVELRARQHRPGIDESIGT